MYGTDKNGTAAEKITHFTLQPLAFVEAQSALAHGIDLSTPPPPSPITPY